MCMSCLNCIHSATNGGPCLNEMAQRASDGSCHCFSDMDKIIELPCKIGDRIFAIIEKKKATKAGTYRYIQSYYLTYSNILILPK